MKINCKKVVTVLNFKKELNSLIGELTKENKDITESTGVDYEYGGIFHPYYDKSSLFIEKAIGFVRENIGNTFFFVEVQTSLINNLESNLASLEFELKENNNRIEQLCFRNKVLWSEFYFPLSNVIGKSYELKNNWRTINTRNLKNKQLNDCINNLKIEIKKVSEITDITSLECFLKETYLPNFLSNMSASRSQNKEKTEYLTEFYFHYKTLNVIAISRNRRIDIKEHLTDLSGELIELYNGVGVNINSDDAQFNKYNLISLNGNISITNDKYNRYLNDDRLHKINLHFFPDKKIVDSIIMLLKDGLIVNIAFRISHISNTSVAMEDLAYGSIMPSDIDKIPDISVLYDKVYDDKLIIQHNKDKQEITFEELMDDFILEEDSVVTQVVHIKYVISNEQVFIQHLDHEFIFYSIEEFERKIKNNKTHGSVNKIKTFKIDNSKIPFHYSDARGPFLFNVLESHFIHKNLVYEYFNEVLG